MKTGWKCLAAAMAALILGGCGGKAFLPEGEHPGTLSEILGALEETVPPSVEEPTEMRAVWISYLDLVPVLKGQGETGFSEAFARMADHCLQAGLDTLIVQVRPFGDSFYPSAYFPWSSLIGGELSYDPLTVMTKAAEERGLSFHAWINPLRAMTEAEAAAVSDAFPVRKWYDDPVLREKNLILLDGRVYLNPASSEVRKLIADGAAELAERYPLDGIQIDDYFYPPSLDFSADASSYRQYCREGGSLSQEDWRRENTFRMVRELSAAIKSQDPNMLFGVSPRGQMEQNIQDLYADPEQWAMEKDCLDYLAPQIYYGFENTSAPFQTVAESWNRLAQDAGIPLIVGLAAYKVGGPDLYAGAGEDEWTKDPEVLAKQVAASRKLSAYGGVMFFRYGSIFQPEESRRTAMEQAMGGVLPLISEPAG